MMHKTKLKFAVEKYRELYSQGNGEAETKAEILKDPKGYTAEEVDEIFEALVSGVFIDDTENNAPQGEQQPQGDGQPGDGEQNPQGEGPGDLPGEQNPDDENKGDDDDDDLTDLTENHIPTKEETDRFVNSITADQALVLFNALVEKFGFGPVTATAQAQAAEPEVFEINPDDEFEVIVAFRDAKDFNLMHTVGTDVTDFDNTRLLSMLEKGLIKKKVKE